MLTTEEYNSMYRKYKNLQSQEDRLAELIRLYKKPVREQLYFRPSYSDW